MTPRCARPTWAKASRDAAHLISRVVLFLSRCLILSRAHDSAIVRIGEILPCRIFFLTPIIEATSGKKTTRSQEIQRGKGGSCENQVCATVGAGLRSSEPDHPPRVLARHRARPNQRTSARTPGGRAVRGGEVAQHPGGRGGRRPPPPVRGGRRRGGAGRRGGAADGKSPLNSSLFV